MERCLLMGLVLEQPAPQKTFFFTLIDHYHSQTDYHLEDYDSKLVQDASTKLCG